MGIFPIFRIFDRLLEVCSYRHYLLLVVKKFLFLKNIWAILNDIYLGISTIKTRQIKANSKAQKALHARTFDTSMFDDNKIYSPVEYYHIRKEIRILGPLPHDVFIDLGCGKGRVVCCFARRKLKECIGIDIDPKLCSLAKINSTRLNGAKTPMRFICGDVAYADLSFGTIYYMFHPFGPSTLKEELRKIEASLRSNYRKIKIVYHNAIHEEILIKTSWIEKYYSFSTVSNLPVSIWRSTITVQ